MTEPMRCNARTLLVIMATIAALAAGGAPAIAQDLISVDAISGAIGIPLEQSDTPNSVGASGALPLVVTPTTFDQPTDGGFPPFEWTGSGSLSASNSGSVFSVDASMSESSTAVWPGNFLYGAEHVNALWSLSSDAYIGLGADVTVTGYLGAGGYASVNFLELINSQAGGADSISNSFTISTPGPFSQTFTQQDPFMTGYESSQNIFSLSIQTQLDGTGSINIDPGFGFSLPAAAVPEPASCILLGLGAIGLAVAIRRRTA